MRKLILMAMLMLLSLSVFFSSAPPAKCMDKFCTNCQSTCFQDYQALLYQCYQSHSTTYCDAYHKDFMYNCGVVMCPLCEWYQVY